MTPPSNEEVQPTISVENLTRGQTLVEAAEVADNPWTRFRGLIGHKPLEPGEGLLIVPCSSIHTHFMSFPIDVLYVGKDHKIVGINGNLKPWRFGSFLRKVRYVIELPAGTAETTGCQAGDQLRVNGYKL